MEWIRKPSASNGAKIQPNMYTDLMCTAKRVHPKPTFRWFRNTTDISMKARNATFRRRRDGKSIKTFNLLVNIASAFTEIFIQPRFEMNFKF